MSGVEPYFLKILDMTVGQAKELGEHVRRHVKCADWLSSRDKWFHLHCTPSVHSRSLGNGDQCVNKSTSPPNEPDSC